MSRYYLPIPVLSGDRLTLNVTGISSEGDVDPSGIRFHLNAIDPHTYQPRFSTTFDHSAASDLYRHIGAISAVRDKAAASVGRIVEVGDDGVPAALLEAIRGDSKAIETIIVDNLEVVKKVIQHRLNEAEVVGLAYRQEQLAEFQRLLFDPAHFDSARQTAARTGPEQVWQSFFEQNPWVFGSGLTYVYTSSLDKRKLEQITTGADIAHAGKRVDALLKTRGFVSSLCFVEIKHHQTPLTHHTQYRPSVWRASDELTGAIAQVQKTVDLAIRTIGRKLEPVDESGFPTGERLFAFRPRSFVVAGTLSEFVDDHRNVNEERFASFELFRRSLSGTEVVTFDELLARVDLSLSNPATN